LHPESSKFQKFVDSFIPGGEMLGGMHANYGQNRQPSEQVKRANAGQMIGLIFRNC
jgi:hypothetical protein